VRKEEARQEELRKQSAIAQEARQAESRRITGIDLTPEETRKEYKRREMEREMEESKRQAIEAIEKFTFEYKRGGLVGVMNVVDGCNKQFDSLNEKDTSAQRATIAINFCAILDSAASLTNEYKSVEDPNYTKINSQAREFFSRKSG
jgi:hypothetical protein